MAEGKKVGSIFAEFMLDTGKLEEGKKRVERNLHELKKTAEGIYAHLKVSPFRRNLEASISRIRERFGGIGTAISSVVGVGRTLFSGMATAIRTTFSTLKTYFLNWKTFMVGMFAAVFAVNKIKKFASGIIDASSSYEQLRLSLKVLLKDQEKANAAFKEGLEISKQTPFDITEVLEQYKLLLAYQFEQKEIPKIIMLASDAATAYGKSLDEVVRGVAYLKAGRLEESLAGLGVTREALAGKGIKFDAGGSLKSSAQELMDAVFSMWSETVSGISEEGTKTWKGMVSNLKNEWIDFQAKVGDAGFFEAVKRTLSGILDQINKWATEDKIQEWAEKISTYLTKAWAGVTGIVGALVGIDLGNTILSVDSPEIEKATTKLQELQKEYEHFSKNLQYQEDPETIEHFNLSMSKLERQINNTETAIDKMSTKEIETTAWVQTIIETIEEVKKTFSGEGSFVENLVNGIAEAFKKIDLGSLLYDGVDWAGLGVDIMADVISGFKKEIVRHGGLIGLLKGNEAVETYYGTTENIGLDGQGIVRQL